MSFVSRRRFGFQQGWNVASHTLQCSHRFLIELWTFIPRVCCVTAWKTGVEGLEAAMVARGLVKAACDKVRICVAGCAACLVAIVRTADSCSAPKERARLGNTMTTTCQALQVLNSSCGRGGVASKAPFGKSRNERLACHVPKWSVRQLAATDL